MIEFIVYSLAISAVWIVAVKLYYGRIVWEELGMHVGIAVLTALITSFVFVKGPSRSNMILTDQISSKERVRVSCSHSYDCNPKQVCRRDSDGHRTCRTEYETCYEHTHDYRWRLNTDHLGRFYVDRVDRQGTTEPPRYTKAKIGDPVSDTKSYVDYVKSAPGTIFNVSDVKLLTEKYAGNIPTYPGNIYDIHYNDKILTAMANPPNLSGWHRLMDERLKTGLSISKRLNVIIIFTDQPSLDYADAVSAAWLGGRINDVIVIVSTTTWPTMDWVRVLSWSDNEIFKVQLRDAVYGLKTIDRDTFIDTVFSNIDGYSAKDPKDFQYLEAHIQTPMWAIGAALFLNLVMNVLCTIFIHRRKW